MVGVGSLLLAASLLSASPVSSPPPKAGGPKMELGTSIANVTFLLGSGGGVLAGVPAGIQSFLSPSAYLTAFMGSNIAIEPQFGFILAHSAAASTDTILNLGANVDCFLAGTTANSLYVFGGVGVIAIGGSGSGHQYSFGGGAGYRIREGDRFVIRMSGVFTRIKGTGNLVSINVSIGGTFGGS